MKFYNDILIAIEVVLDYSCISDPSCHLRSLTDDVFIIIGTALSKRVGEGKIGTMKSRVFTKMDIPLKTWFSGKARIDLGMDSGISTLGFTEVILSYNNDKLTKLAKQNITKYREELEQKEFQEQLDNAEGF